MSGTFDIEQLIGGFTTDLFYSSPLHFLPGMEGPDLDRLRERFVYLPSGSGAWEDVGESWRAAEVLGTKCVPNRGRRLGPRLRSRLADLVADAPQLRTASTVITVVGPSLNADRDGRRRRVGSPRVGVRAEPSAQPDRGSVNAPLGRPRPLRRRANPRAGCRAYRCPRLLETARIRVC
jgi:hypothetical protein